MRPAVSVGPTGGVGTRTTSRPRSCRRHRGAPRTGPGCSLSLAVTSRPSAVTRSTETRLSQVSPYLRSNQPDPPPSVRPATPVVETRPPVVASPCSWVARSNSPQVTPAPTRTCRASASTSIAFIGRTSMTSPPSFRRHSRHRVTAGADRHLVAVLFGQLQRRITSAGDAHCAITAGCLSIMALKMRPRLVVPRVVSVDQLHISPFW